MIRDLRHPRAIRMAAQARAGRISDERGMRRLLPSSGPGSAVIRSCVSSRATGSTVAARASSPGRISSAPCSGTSLTRRVRTRPTSPAQCSFRRPGGFKPRASALIEKASRDVARAADRSGGTGIPLRRRSRRNAALLPGPDRCRGTGIQLRRPSRRTPALRLRPIGRRGTGIPLPRPSLRTPPPSRSPPAGRERGHVIASVEAMKEVLRTVEHISDDSQRQTAGKHLDAPLVHRYTKCNVTPAIAERQPRVTDHLNFVELGKSWRAPASFVI
jgi:hypothetical protein